MVPIRSLHKYDLCITIPEIFVFERDGEVEAHNKQEAALKYKQKYQKELEKWPLNVLEHYVKRSFWL